MLGGIEVRKFLPVSILFLLILVGCVQTSEKTSISSMTGEREYASLLESEATGKQEGRAGENLVGTLKIKIETSTPEPTAFTFQTVYYSSMARGERQKVQDGVNGEKCKLYEVSYLDGEELTRTLTREIVTQAPAPEITAIGTGQRQ